MSLRSAIPGWDNDDLTNPMFRGLPKKDVDSGSYNSKYRFWSDIILKAPEHIKSYSITLELLKQNLQRDGVLPLCLKPILEVMVDSGELTNCTHLNRCLEIRNQSWTYWGFSQMISLFKSKEEKIQERDCLIVTSVLEDQSIRLWKAVEKNAVNDSDYLQLRSHLETLYDEVFTGFPKNETIPLDTLLKFLQYHGKVCLIMQTGVKFAKYTESPFKPSGWFSSKVVIKESTVDQPILSLRDCIEKLNIRVDKFMNQIQNAKQKALELSAQKQRKAALLYMKRKKNYEDQLAKQLNQISQLETIQEAILQAETDQQIFSAYQSANVALKTIQSGIDLQAINQVMDEVDDSVQFQKEVEEAMQYSADDDEINELEQELAGLLLETKNEPEPKLAEELHNLPEVPTHIPEAFANPIEPITPDTKSHQVLPPTDEELLQELDQY